MKSPGVVALLLVLAGCRAAVPEAYAPHDGDLVFQSLPHTPLVDAIEGMTHSPYSHCGMVERRDDGWYVLEAIGPVQETPLARWIARGRGHRFAAYRLKAAFDGQVPKILAAGRTFLGRPYDIHYRFDDERIYCSELIFKAVRQATGREIGRIERIGDLDWKPQEGFIRSIEGFVPLDRELISPRALTEAPEVAEVFASPP